MAAALRADGASLRRRTLRFRRAASPLAEPPMCSHPPEAALPMGSAAGCGLRPGGAWRWLCLERGLAECGMPELRGAGSLPGDVPPRWARGPA